MGGRVMKTFLNYVKLNRLTGDDLIICQNYAESCHTKKTTCTRVFFIVVILMICRRYS